MCGQPLGYGTSRLKSAPTIPGDAPSRELNLSASVAESTIEGVIENGIVARPEQPMTRIVINAEIRKLLHNLSEPVELCDDTGRVVVRVTPAVDLSEWDVAEPEDDEAELQRREKETESFTTDEMISYLEKL
jgi:hypothetical protein